MTEAEGPRVRIHPKVTRYTGEQDPSLNMDVKLTSNAAVEAFASRLRTAEPNWEDIFQQAHANAGRSRNTEHFTGLVAEAHVTRVLHDLSAEQEGRFNLDPIPRNADSENYRFRKDAEGNVVAWRKDRREAAGEYDILFEAGIPVLGEVKATTSRSGGVSRRDLLGKKAIEKKFGPLQEYYSQQGVDEFGYMAISVPDVLITDPPREEDGEILIENHEQLFVARGGILVVLPIESAEFREQGQRLMDWYREHEPTPPKRKARPSRPIDRIINTSLADQLRAKFGGQLLGESDTQEPGAFTLAQPEETTQSVSPPREESDAPISVTLIDNSGIQELFPRTEHEVRDQEDGRDR
jgi:hypothetical protein